MYVESTQKVRALESISKGEEIFVSYIDIGDSCLGRKSVLKKNYMFECKCERCKAELLTDTFKYGISCSRCKDGYCTFANKQCTGCGVEMGFDQWKAVNRKVDKISEMLKEVDKFVLLKENIQTNRNNKKNMVKHWLNAWQRTRYSKDCTRSSTTISTKCWKFCLVYLYKLKSIPLNSIRHSYGNAYNVCKELYELYAQCFPKGSPNVAIVEYKLGKLEVYIRGR